MDVHDSGGVGFAPPTSFARPQPKPSLGDAALGLASSAAARLRSAFGTRRRGLVGVLVVVFGLGGAAVLAVGRSTTEGSVTVDAAPALPLTAGSLPLEFGRPADPDPTPSVSAVASSAAPPVPPAAMATPSVTVVVHAAGAVARPGIYRLPEPARVDDVVTAAGGLAADADPDVLNLAARVGDGERIFVPKRGQSPPGVVVGSTGSAPVPASAVVGDKAVPPAAGVVDLNTATAEQLDTLPGVGPAIASRIIDARTRLGRFRSVNQLLDVPGIGEAKFSQLRARVKV
jgi:competence protein ComEA